MPAPGRLVDPVAHALDECDQDGRNRLDMIALGCNPSRRALGEKL
jgi:hypothetical protein